jgi:hypothetical protein
MDKKIVLVLSVMIVLLLAIGVMTLAIINSGNKKSIDPNSVTGKTESCYIHSSNPEGYGSSMNYDYPNVQSSDICGGANSNPDCFVSPSIEQQRGEVNYNIPEQNKREPCQQPKPQCLLCRENLIQTKGYGHSDIPVQVHESC